MARRRWKPNEIAFVLAVVAAVLIVFAHVNGARRVDAILDAVTHFLGPNPVLRVLSFVLIGLATLGGGLVALGGVLILRDRVRSGRLLILLGTGFGVVGLVLFFLANLERERIPFADGIGPGALGVLLSIAARLTSRVPERSR